MFRAPEIPFFTLRHMGDVEDEKYGGGAVGKERPSAATTSRKIAFLYFGPRTSFLGVGIEIQDEKLFFG